jgi:hypothetical protein
MGLRYLPDAGIVPWSWTIVCNFETKNGGYPAASRVPRHIGPLVSLSSRRMRGRGSRFDPEPALTDPLLASWVPMRLPQAHPGPTAILIDEFDAG